MAMALAIAMVNVRPPSLASQLLPDRVCLMISGTTQIRRSRLAGDGDGDGDGEFEAAIAGKPAPTDWGWLMIFGTTQIRRSRLAGDGVRTVTS